jgi:hypothetical protein
MRQVIKNLTSALAVMAIAAGSLIFGIAPANAVGGYYPKGPQLNVPISAITGGGWKLCWSGLYSDYTSTLAAVRSSCSQKYLLEAAGQVGASNYMLAAAGERSAVFNTTALNGTTLNNGTYWYFNDNSMGFSPNATIDQVSADIFASNAWDPADMLFRPYDGTEDYRLSWHTSGDNISGGWRAGKVVWLNSTSDIGTQGVHGSGSDYIRAIYQSDNPMPKQVARIDSVSFVDDGTGTGGNLIWTGSFIDAVMFAGDKDIYPGAFNYGAFTTHWNGRVYNLKPATKYTVSISAVSEDDLGETKSFTFSTPALLPVDANAKGLTVSKDEQSANLLAKLITQIDLNSFYPGEANNMKTLLNKFNALVTSPHRTFIKVPTSRVSKVVANSLTPKSCSVESNGVVRATSSETCTVSYTVTGASKAPVTFTKDFNFSKFNAS